jgi:hypothetical protein
VRGSLQQHFNIPKKLADLEFSLDDIVQLLWTFFCHTNTLTFFRWLPAIMPSAFAGYQRQKEHGDAVTSNSNQPMNNSGRGDIERAVEVHNFRLAN